MTQTTRRSARRKPARTSYSSSKKKHPYRVQRWFATFFLALVATIGLGIYGANKTVLNSDFTTKTLTTGDNLNTITTQVQKNVGVQTGKAVTVSTLVSRAISTATAKAVVTTAVADVYTNTTNQIDFTAMDSAVKSALSPSSTGLSSTITTLLASEVLSRLHDYFNNELASRTATARAEYQEVAKGIHSLIIPLIVIAVVLAVWLFLVAGFSGFLHNLGWVGLVAGLLGLGVLQLGQKLPMVDTLTAKFGDFQLVAADYIAQTVNHMSGYYIIAAVAGLIVLLVTIPFVRRANR